jgi:hypothetical protein
MPKSEVVTSEAESDFEGEYYIFSKYSSNCAAILDATQGSPVCASTDIANRPLPFLRVRNYGCKQHRLSVSQWKIRKHMNGEYSLQNVGTLLMACHDRQTSSSPGVIGLRDHANLWRITREGPSGYVRYGIRHNLGYAY